MVVFRFADSPELHIECSASVFPKILTDVMLPSCPLHAGGSSSSSAGGLGRKRREDFEGDFEDFSIDFTYTPTDKPDTVYEDL